MGGAVALMNSAALQTLADRNAARLAELHPVFTKRITGMLGALGVLGIQASIVEGLRTYETQAKYFAEGRTAMSTVACKHNGITRRLGTCSIHPRGATITKAPPGYSWHQFALAVDLVPDDIAADGISPDWNVQHPSWQQMLRVGKGFDLAEGALWRTFPDYPHFQPVELSDTPGDTIRKLYAEQGMAAVWSHLSSPSGNLPVSFKSVLDPEAA